MDWKTIVIGVDGSSESVQAAALGAKIAARLGARAHLVHSAPDYWSAMTAGDVGIIPEVMNRAAIDSARQLLTYSLEGNVPAELIRRLDVRIGKSAAVLASIARDEHADVVILGGKRRRALTLIGGSTVTHMVRMGSVPVLATDGSTVGIDRILVATDLSWAARPTLEAATELATRFGAALRVLHVVEPTPVIPGLRIPIAEDEMYRAAERTVLETVTPLASHVRGAEVVVRRGRAAAAITTEARQWRADLIVLGSHGKGWVDRLLIGSTSERLLQLLPASVLVIPVSQPTAHSAEPHAALPWEISAAR